MILSCSPVIRDRLDAAVLAAEIPAWSFGGFIWMQGENEANSTEAVAQAYATNFAGLAQTIRSATAPYFTELQA